MKIKLFTLLLFSLVLTGFGSPLLAQQRESIQFQQHAIKKQP